MLLSNVWFRSLQEPATQGSEVEMRGMRRVIFWMVAVVLVSVVPSAGQHTVKEGITFLDTQDLKTIYGKGSFVLVNTLSPIEFKAKRIAGSVNVPLSHFADEKVSLPGDKETRMVFYCMGEK